MRRFDEHIKRKTYSLDGIWKFSADKDRIGIEKEWFKCFPKESITVSVPGCINNRLGYMEFQQVAWYQKEFHAVGQICIKFYAVSEYAKVYLDGEYLGDHYGGFTSFEFERNVCEGMHTLTVMVDSQSTEDTIPQWAVDWHHYCGIIRSVEVSEFQSTAIQNMRVEYELSDNLKKAKVCVYVNIKGYGTAPIRTDCRIHINGLNIYNKSVAINDSLEICGIGIIDDVRLWDIDKPELYMVTVQTDDDDLIDRIGFRKIEVIGKTILLNNKPIKLIGVNRHEEHPDWGFALPPALMAKDMDLLKDLGVNAVRGSHYPNSKHFVDMCDEEGILFWSEIPMWGFEKETLSRELVIQRGLNMHREMIEQYYNHPSIIIWGMHNEVATDSKQGIDITKKFLKFIKSLDNSRLVTYATNRILKDECLQLTDFISVNQYVGWYEGEISEWEAFLKDMKKYIREKGVDNKPVVMSEFGVGAVFGTKTFEGLRWSENYQVEFYKQTLDLFLNDNDINGVYLWQFADIRSNAKWSLLRARSFNNKGLINEYRQPKMAYYTVKERLERERNKELRG